MKYVLSALMILMINAQARAASFIEGLEDVPVMEGMKQVPSDASRSATRRAGWWKRS